MLDSNIKRMQFKNKSFCWTFRGSSTKDSSTLFSLFLTFNIYINYIFYSIRLYQAYPLEQIKYFLFLMQF